MHYGSNVIAFTNRTRSRAPLSDFQDFLDSASGVTVPFGLMPSKCKSGVHVYVMARAHFKMRCNPHAKDPSQAVKVATHAWNPFKIVNM